MERQQEYLRQLQDRNRMKKAQQEKSADELMKEEMERGFKTTFRGANSEKDSGSKAMDKPAVKVQQKGLSNDIARRLLGEFDAASSTSNRPTQGKKKTTPRGDLVEESDERSAPTTHSAAAGELQPTETKAVAPAELDVGHLLQSKIKSLSKEQQKALLDLLHTADAPDEIPTYAVPDDDQDLQTAREAEDADGRKGSESECNEDNVETMETVVDPVPAVVIPQWVEKVKRFRIRVYSTWEDSRYCVLQALRCRLHVTLNGQSKYVDLLPHWKAQISAGLSTLSQTHEVVRQLPQLLSQSPSSSASKAGGWKGPVSLTSPLDLIFEGRLSMLPVSSEVWSEQFDSEVHCWQSAELMVWNGTEGSQGTVSAAKDVDVFVDDLCVWSSQLNASSGGVDVAKADPGWTNSWPYESSPSLTVPIVASTSTAAGRMQKAGTKHSNDDSGRLSQSPKKKKSPKQHNRHNEQQHTSSDQQDTQQSSNSAGTVPSWLPAEYAHVPVQRDGKTVMRSADIFFDEEFLSTQQSKQKKSPQRSQQQHQHHQRLTPAEEEPAAGAGKTVPSWLPAEYAHVPVERDGKTVMRSADIFFEEEFLNSSQQHKKKSPKRHPRKNNTATSPSSSASGSASAVVAASNEPPTANSNSATGNNTTGTVPSWLQPDQAHVPVQRDGHAITRSADIFFDQDTNNTASPDRAGEQHATSSASAARRQRLRKHGAQRSSRSSLDSIPESAVPDQMHLHTTASTSSLHTNAGAGAHHDDDALRRSLDAVRHAEQFNLNRLEKSKNKEPDVNETVAFLAALQAAAQSPSASSAIPEQQTQDETMTITEKEPKSSRIPRRQRDQPPEETHTPTSAAAGVQATPSSPDRHEKRAATIGQFSAQLNAKIQDIHGILATMPRKPSWSVLPPASSSAANANAGDAISATISDAVHATPGSDTKKRTAAVVAALPPPSFKQLSTRPEIPRGMTLRLIILSTHGDKNYVGLNGIEVFGESGEALALQSTQVLQYIRAVPADVSVLPGYEHDPRVVRNLIDGVNDTKDDLHQWLAPHFAVAEGSLPTADCDLLRSLSRDAIAVLVLQFVHPVSISLVRVHNFNKSRTHNQRGVQRLRIELDAMQLFEGDVKKASGIAGDGVTDIFVTADATALQRLGQTMTRKDEAVIAQVIQDIDLEESMASVLSRPRTAAKTPAAGAYSYEDSDAVLLEGGGCVGEGVAEQSSFDSSTGMLQNQSSVAASDAAQMMRDSMSQLTANSSMIIAPTTYTATPEHDQDRSQDDISATVDASQASSTQQQQQQEQPLLSSTEFLQAVIAETALISSSHQQQHDTKPTAPTTVYTQPTQMQPTHTHAHVHAVKDTVCSPTGYISTLSVHRVTLDMLSTWGDGDYIGLGGLTLLDAQGQAMAMPPSSTVHWEGQPYGASSSSTSRESVSQLFRTPQNTTDTSTQWLVPQDVDYQQHHHHNQRHNNSRARVTCTFTSPCELSGLRFWNYNGAGAQEVLRGVRELQVDLNGGQCALRVLLRPAPGCDGVSYHQDITFEGYMHSRNQVNNKASASSGGGLNYLTPKLRQTFEHVHAVSGMSLAISCFRNHGDLYYLGLDRVEVVTEELQAVDVLSLAEVSAVPSSVRDLQVHDRSMAHDPRIPSALFQHTHRNNNSNNSNGSGSWLAPLMQCMAPEERLTCIHRIRGHHHAQSNSTVNLSTCSLPSENTMFIQFHFPMRIAAIRIWNYSKSPARGVRDFQVKMDGQIVYQGALVSCEEEKRTMDGISRGQVLCFSQEPRVLNAFKELAVNVAAQEQDVLCINERQVMVRSKTMYTEPSAQQIDLQQRPSTSFHPR